MKPSGSKDKLDGFQQRLRLRNSATATKEAAGIAAAISSSSNNNRGLS